MTELYLLEALKNELEDLFEGEFFWGAEKTRVPMQVFEMWIPYSIQDKDACPYIVVRMVNETEGEDGGNADVAHVRFLVGARNSDEATQGHKDLLNILFRIKSRFKKNYIVGGCYRRIEGSLELNVQEETAFPYFFGSIDLAFAVPAFTKEEPLA